MIRSPPFFFLPAFLRVAFFLAFLRAFLAMMLIALPNVGSGAPRVSGRKCEVRIGPKRMRPLGGIVNAQMRVEGALDRG